MTEAEYIGSELHAADKQIAELKTRVSDLEVALRPFAEAARRTLASHPNSVGSTVVWNGVTWSNFVRAAEILKD